MKTQKQATDLRTEPRRPSAWLAAPCLVVLAYLCFFTLFVRGQDPQRSRTGAPSGGIEGAIDLALKGHCVEALPLLKQGTRRVSDKQMKYRALMALVRCSLNQRDDQTTADALFDLKRDFPQDPEVLYMTAQFFLDVATRASQELVDAAPNSAQVREMQAEALESQNKWAEAAAIYKKILEENPKLRGIHFRLGRAALQPGPQQSVEDARREFEQELAIDPVNAAAEFYVGKLAGSDGQWDVAITHYESAVRIDPSFAEAMLALGTALNAAGRFQDAIPQLERYTRAAASDPAGHYQLALAYARTGRKEDSVREMAIQRELFEKEQAEAAKKSTANPQ